MLFSNNNEILTLICGFAEIVANEQFNKVFQLRTLVTGCELKKIWWGSSWQMLNVIATDATGG